jgi:hypothetical protein
MFTPRSRTRRRPDLGRSDFMVILGRNQPAPVRRSLVHGTPTHDGTLGERPASHRANTVTSACVIEYGSRPSQTCRTKIRTIHRHGFPPTWRSPIRQLSDFAERPSKTRQPIHEPSDIVELFLGGLGGVPADSVGSSHYGPRSPSASIALRYGHTVALAAREPPSRRPSDYRSSC